MEIRITFNQFETDEDDGTDYGIVNAWWGNNHHADVYDCDNFAHDGIDDVTKYMTGLDNFHLTRMPFNPYGDGFEWIGHTL